MVVMTKPNICRDIVVESQKWRKKTIFEKVNMADFEYDFLENYWKFLKTEFRSWVGIV